MLVMSFFETGGKAIHELTRSYTKRISVISWIAFKRFELCNPHGR